VNINLALNGPQMACYKLLGPRRTVALPWGRGVGKSWWLRQVAWLLQAKHRDEKVHPDSPSTGVRVLFVMSTKEHFREVHGLHLERENSNEWAFLGGKLNRTTGTIIFPNGGWFMSVPAAEATSKWARGLRGDVGAYDEADDIDTSVYHAVCIPWFSEPWSLALNILGGTPRRGRYGLLYRMHELGLQQHRGHHTIHATWRDSPQTVSREAVEEARGITPGPVFQREWEANFDSAEGLVYDLFDEAFHVRRPQKDARPARVVVGVDWGYADPGVVLLGHVYGHGNDAVLHIVREWYEPGRVLDYWTEVAKEVQRPHPRAEWYADPSQPANIESLRAKAGITIRGADNSIDQGVTCVADKLAIRGSEADRWARLYVAPECRNTIRELTTYRRKADPHNRDQYLDAFEDRNNHAMDALRYMAFGLFGAVPSILTETRTAHSMVSRGTYAPF